MINELYILISFFITGIIIGIVFDVFRITRRIFNIPDILVYIEDILFWLISGGLIIFTTFLVNSGELRLYMLTSLCFGVLIYIICVSKYFILINTKIFSFFKFIITKLLFPFQKIYFFLKKYW